MLVPSRGDVPRPRSSTKTKELGPHDLKRAGTSLIFAPNADLFSVGTSADAPRTKRLSNLRIAESEPKGAASPLFGSNAAAAVALITVLFQRIFGAVKRNMPSTSKVLATASDLSIQYGHT